MADAITEIGWDNSEAMAGARQYDNIVRNAAQRTAKAFNGVVPAVVGAFAGLQGFSFAEEAVRAAADLDALRDGYKALASQGENTAISLERIGKLAELPGLGMEEALEGVTNLKAVGFSLRQSERIMREFGNSLAIVGKGKNELTAITTALSQMVGAGKVNAEDLNQLYGNLPQLRGLVKDIFGTTDTEALQRASVSVNVFIDSLVSRMEQGARAAAGLKNELENLDDRMKKQRADFGKRVAPAYLAGQGLFLGAVEGTQQFLIDVSDSFQKASETSGGFFDKIAAGAQEFMRLGKAWNDSFTPETKNAAAEMLDLAKATDDMLEAAEQMKGFGDMKSWSGPSAQAKKSLELLEQLRDATSTEDGARLQRLHEQLFQLQGKAGVNKASDVLADPGRFNADQIAAATELAKLETQIAELNEKIARTKSDIASKADEAAKRVATMRDAELKSMKSLEEQARIADLINAGRARAAQRLRDDIELQQRALEIEKLRGVTRAEAVKLAGKLIEAEKRENGGKVPFIKGFTQDRNRFTNPFRGLDARNESLRNRTFGAREVSTPGLDAFQRLQDRKQNPLGTAFGKQQDRNLLADKAAANNRMSDTGPALLAEMRTMNTGINNLTQTFAEAAGI